MNPERSSINEKEIIFFTHLVPLPPAGGGTRSYHILKSLAQTAKVTLVIFNSLNTKELEILNKVCAKVLYADQKDTIKGSKLFRKLRTAVKCVMPFLMTNYELTGRLLFLLQTQAKFFPVSKSIFFHWLFFWFKYRDAHPSEIYQVGNNIDSLQKNINQLLKAEGKTLLFDFNYFLPAINEKFNLKGHKIISNSHNVESDLLQQSLQVETNFKNRAWLKAQHTFMEKAERLSLGMSDKVFCCSENDRKFYQTMEKDASVFVIPNGVDTQYFFPVSKDNPCMSLLFTGTMNYYPNQQAVSWFTDKIFPILLERYPRLIFVIAGKHADKLVFNSHPNIQVIANPEDMRPYFLEACIYIVPLKQGGGTRLKILEAAAMGKPVVSTRLGAEGLENLNGTNIMLADSEQEFGQAIQLLFENKTLRNRLSSNLNKWVNKWYSWEKIGNELKGIVFN